MGLKIQFWTKQVITWIFVFQIQWFHVKSPVQGLATFYPEIHKGEENLTHTFSIPFILSDLLNGWTTYSNSLRMMSSVSLNWWSMKHLREKQNYVNDQICRSLPHRGAVEMHHEPFTRIEGKRVGVFDSLKPRSKLWTNESASSIGCVYV